MRARAPRRGLVAGAGAAAALLIVAAQVTLGQDEAPRPVTGPARGPSRPPSIRGVALGLFSEDPRHDYLPQLEEIRGLGASHVAVVMTSFQRDIYSAEIYADPQRTPTVETIRRTLRQARQLGLATMLFPYVRVDEKLEPQHWRGTLAPRDLDAWFASYTAWIGDLAGIAEAEGVEILSLGSEMSTMDVEEQRFRTLIRSVRSLFSRRLTYSSNWDHYESVGFWDDLDLIGLTGYFELVPPDVTEPSEEQIVEGWREWHQRLMRWQHHQGRPLLMTEVGYRSNDGAAAFPWRWGEEQNRVDLEEQRQLYEAFRRVWSDEPRLGGVFFWNWWGEGGPSCHDYTPRGKPAEQALRRWFGGALHRAATPG